MAFKLVI